MSRDGDYPMRLQLPARFFVAWLVLGHGAGASAQNAAPRAPESLAQSPVSQGDRGGAAPAEQSPSHEAFQSSAASRDPERFDKAPPSLIAERPGSLPPSPNARWIEGYWDWDKSRRDFTWVTGTWLVPPPGKFWVSGYWRRDGKGWYRVPGFGGGGGDAPKEGRPQEPPRDSRRVVPPPPQEPPRDSRRVVPPPPRPEEPIGLAPGPDFFYVQTEYVPGGSGV